MKKLLVVLMVLPLVLAACNSGLLPNAETVSGTVIDRGLNPSLPPSSNFYLGIFNLQEPNGSTGISLSGLQNAYFYTDKTDGSMTFWDPSTGTPTSGSLHPRTELREINTDGSNAAWAVATNPGLDSTNELLVTEKVTQVPDHVCIGQIFQAVTTTQPNSKPFIELFYYNTGKIVAAVEATPAGGNEVQTTVATVPLGTQFTYYIGIQVPPSGPPTLFVDINNTATYFQQNLSTAFAAESFYFKAGDYDQTATSGTLPTSYNGTGTIVKLYSLQVKHINRHLGAGG